MAHARRAAEKIVALMGHVLSMLCARILEGTMHDAVVAGCGRFIAVQARRRSSGSNFAITSMLQSIGYQQSSSCDVQYCSLEEVALYSFGHKRCAIMVIAKLPSFLNRQLRTFFVLISSSLVSVRASASNPETMRTRSSSFVSRSCPAFTAHLLRICDFK